MLLSSWVSLVIQPFDFHQFYGFELVFRLFSRANTFSLRKSMFNFSCICFSLFLSSRARQDNRCHGGSWLQVDVESGSSYQVKYNNEFVCINYIGNYLIIITPMVWLCLDVRFRKIQFKFLSATIETCLSDTVSTTVIGTLFIYHFVVSCFRSFRTCLRISNLFIYELMITSFFCFDWVNTAFLLI